MVSINGGPNFQDTQQCPYLRAGAALRGGAARRERGIFISYLHFNLGVLW